MKIRRVDFSPDEWLGGTYQLTNAERGLYITACALMYSVGGPITKEHLRAACQDHGHSFNAQLKRLQTLGKLISNGGQIINKRVSNELENAAKRSENASQNASKRWNNNGIDDAVALPPSTARARVSINHQPSTIKSAHARDKHLNLENGRGCPDGILPSAPWPQRVAGFRKSQFWNVNHWGPKPGEPGCRVPAELLAD